MPGPVSDSTKGRRGNHPYIPSWNYPNNRPKMCPCGHHEGYHAGPGERCIHSAAHDNCGCLGLPVECFTTDDEFYERPTPAQGEGE